MRVIPVIPAPFPLALASDGNKHPPAGQVRKTSRVSAMTLRTPGGAHTHGCSAEETGRGKPGASTTIWRRTAFCRQNGLNKDHNSSNSRMGASSLPSGSSNVSCNAGSEAAFFYPGDDHLTGYTESPLKPSQAAALLIGMQDLLPAFFWIRMWCGILTALSAAGTVEIFLLSIGRSTITHQCITPAMRTTNNDSDHGAFHLSHVSWSYAITSFSFLPLPIIIVWKVDAG